MVSEDMQMILKSIHHINVRHPRRLEWDAQLSSGARVLKKKALWSWQEYKIVSENKFCNILLDLGVASTNESAKVVASNLDNLHIDYEGGRWLNIGRRQTPSGLNYHFDLYIPE